MEKEKLNRDGKHIYLQLFLVYAVCFLLAVFNFYTKKKKKIIIDKEAKTVSVKRKVFSFNDVNDFEVEHKSGWFSDDILSYGLFLKQPQGKSRFIYGDSVLRDIEKLKCELDDHLSGL